MKKYIVIIPLLVALISQSQEKLTESKKNNNKDLPNWCVEHSILTRYFEASPLGDSIVIKFSNDGKYFFFVSKRGNLKKDQNDYMFYFFETGKVEKELSLHPSKEKFIMEPLKKIPFNTDIWGPLYDTWLQWSEDNKSVVFLCLDKKTTSFKVLNLNIKEGSIKEIHSYNYKGGSTWSEQIIGINKDASTILFKYDKYIINDAPTYSEYPEIPLNTQDLVKVLYNSGNGKSTTCNLLYCKNKIKELPFNVEPINRAHLVDVSWNDDENKLLLTYQWNKSNNSTFNIVYGKKNSQWVQLTPVPKEDSTGKQVSIPSNGLKIQISQDVNTVPMIIASNGKNEIHLIEPDTALTNVYIATTKTIKWKVADGREFTGGLTLPRSYDGKQRLPLVIQSYEYQPNLFLPDGVSTSGYAMQPLVANGFAVLQISIATDDLKEKYGGVIAGWEHSAEEGPDYVEKIDKVVEMLSEQGIVDKNKVGLIGFSRAGYEALLAVTNPGKIKLAAAMDLDGWTGTYYNYLLEPEPESTHLREWENVYGGKFWRNKAEWLKQEPSFNAEKVNTPILFSAHASIGTAGVTFKVYSYSSILGALNLNKKPYEFLVYPNGSHDLRKPQEIYAAINTTIDWMNFWLKGVEDSDPTKVERYKRWRELKKMQDAASIEKK